MSAFTYTAKRGLIAGHVVDTVYSFDLKIKKYEIQDSIDANQQTSPTYAETTFNHAITSHKFTTIALSYTEYLECREFLLSALDGQLITFDVDGSVSVPVNSTSGKIKLQKNLKASQPSHKMYAFSFEILELQ